MPRISKYHEIYESSILQRNYIKIYSVLLIILNEEKFLLFCMLLYDYMQISLYLRINHALKKDEIVNKSSNRFNKTFNDGRRE